MNVRRTLIGVGAGLLTIGAVLGATAAHAANRHTVLANVTKPEVACQNFGVLPQGAWLANKSCGYILGTAMAGSTFDNHENIANNFHYGRSYQSGGSSFCAWIIPSAFGSDVSTVADSCSSTTRDAMRHRRLFGRDFDNEPHVGNGAPTVLIDASRCQGFFNYFDSSTFASGSLKNPVGYTLPTTGSYRYSSNDRQAAMVRVGEGSGPPPSGTTWLFVSRSCIESQISQYPLSNTDD